MISEKYKSRMTEENRNHLIKTLFLSKTKLISDIIILVLEYANLTVTDLRHNHLLLPSASMCQKHYNNYKISIDRMRYRRAIRIAQHCRWLKLNMEPSIRFENKFDSRYGAQDFKVDYRSISIKEIAYSSNVVLKNGIWGSTDYDCTPYYGGQRVPCEDCGVIVCGGDYLKERRKGSYMKIKCDACYEDYTCGYKFKDTSVWECYKVKWYKRKLVNNS